MRNDRERLLDMLEAIERIERHTAGGRKAFEQDELIQTWVVHHLQIVGEAAAKLGRQFHVLHPRFPGLRLLPCATCSSTTTSASI